MYITINNVIGEKTIDLAHPIFSHSRSLAYSLARSAEIAVISLFSDNVRYEIEKPLTLELGIGNAKKLQGIYSGREIIKLLEWKIELKDFEKNQRLTKTNKLSGITEMNLSLDELDNTENLKDGKPSNSLLKYHVTKSEHFTRFEPRTPQYKRLKSGRIVSLTLRITDQNDNIMTNPTSLVLHVR